MALCVENVNELTNQFGEREPKRAIYLDEPALEAFVVDCTDVALARARLDHLAGISSVAVVTNPALGFPIPAVIWIEQRRDMINRQTTIDNY